MNRPITIFDRGYDEHGQLPSIFEKDDFFQNNFTQAISPSVFSSGELPSNLDVRGYIQSSGFKTGSTGWKLNSDGNLEANSGSFTGAVTATSGSFTGAVYASSGSFTGAVYASSGSFTGAVNVGSTSNTKIDGANDRFLVNDGVTDRVLIGKGVGLF